MAGHQVISGVATDQDDELSIAARPVTVPEGEEGGTKRAGNLVTSTGDSSDIVDDVITPRVKIQHGEDGVARDTSHADPLPIRDIDNINLQILKELKKMNMHLSLITDQIFGNDDLPGA